jgi:undecaprenyl-diphosphatase
MTSFQAILMALVQGLTELFPVSSLGHAVILPILLGWKFDQQAAQFLPFLVVLHVGTAVALLIYFWKDWYELLLAALGKGESAEDVAGKRHLIVLLIAGTLPAVVLGFALEKELKHVFGSPEAAAAFLTINGFVLFMGERLRRRAHAKNKAHDLTKAGWPSALLIGLFQATALIPGISRSGATMVGGLLTGLKHEDSARFSFLLATPIILAAAVFEIPKLLHAGVGMAGSPSASVLWGAGIVAGVTAFASTAFLMRYFKMREESAPLDLFAYYCWIAGGGALLYLSLR